MCEGVTVCMCVRECVCVCVCGVCVCVFDMCGISLIRPHGPSHEVGSDVHTLPASICFPRIFSSLFYGCLHIPAASVRDHSVCVCVCVVCARVCVCVCVIDYIELCPMIFSAYEIYKS